MRKTKYFLLLICMFLLTGLACSSISLQAEPTALPTSIQQPSTSNIPLTEADVPRISAEEAKAALDSGAAVIVDVRSAEAYASSHAAGAISIPLDNFETNIGSISLEQDQCIITYCT
jgi:3-mercaptopyruvate sulfurtransferase SseA